MAGRSLLSVFPSRHLMSRNVTCTSNHVSKTFSISLPAGPLSHSGVKYSTSGGTPRGLVAVSYSSKWTLLRQEASETGCASSAVKPLSASWCAVRCYASKKAKKEKVTKGGKKKVALSEEELEGVLDRPRLEADMQAVVDDLRTQMIQQVTLRTNIGAYDKLQVKTEDGVFPLIQLAQVVQKSPSLILINLTAAPQYIPAVKEAIENSGLNVNPQQDGTTIFIPLPNESLLSKSLIGTPKVPRVKELMNRVTREFREQLARSAKSVHDKAKTRLRDIHNKFVKKVKAAKDHHPEDTVKAAQDLVLEEMHSYGQQLDAMLTAKQQELLGAK